MSMNRSSESRESAVVTTGAGQAAPLRKPWERPAVRVLDVRETQASGAVGNDGVIGVNS